jgi:hypothetical protein
VCRASLPWLSRLRDVDALGEQRGVVLSLTLDGNALANPQRGEGEVLIPSLLGLSGRVVVGVGAGDDGQPALLSGEDECGSADRLDRPVGDVALSKCGSA